MTRLPAEYGPLHHKARSYGVSENGLTLEVYQPSNYSPKFLIMGSIHGDESLSTVLLSEALRSIPVDELKSAVVLSVNPDGILAGTRCNAKGVDLNRNFPTKNWETTPVYYRNRPGDPQNIALSPGSSGGSESETQAIIKLVNELQPTLIVSLHGFLDCIDDPDSSAIAQDLAIRTEMELVPDVGYNTPGSFGSWCKEQDIPIITYELPASAIVEMKEKHVPVLTDLLTGHYHNILG